MEAQLTQDQYTDRSGLACPVCKGVNIESIDTLEQVIDTVTQTIRCGDCDAMWTDLYELSGFDLLTDK